MRHYYQSLHDPDQAPEYFATLREYLRGEAAPGADVTVAGRPGQTYRGPAGASDAAAAVEAAVAASTADFDTFILGNFSDVGISEARLRSTIPVFGLGECTLKEAKRFGERVGLVALNGAYISSHEARTFLGVGLEPANVVVESANLDIAELARAFSDASTAARIVARFLETSAAFSHHGVQSIVPAGGVLMLLLEKQGIRRVSGLPIVEGISATIRYATQALEYYPADPRHPEPPPQ